MYNFMIEIDGQLKKWGNSIGLRLSKKDLFRNRFKLNQKVKVLIVPERNILKETFGTGKFRGSTEKLLKQVDKELYND